MAEQHASAGFGTRAIHAATRSPNRCTTIVRTLPSEVRAGILTGLVHVSVGLEDVTDLAAVCSMAVHAST